MTSALRPDFADPFDRALELMSGDLARFHETLANTLEPQRPYLTETEYAIYGRGKKLRPLLLLLVARMTHGGAPDEPLPERVIKAAVALEMLHVATLIHDDIIDLAPRRRGLASVNAARGSDIALLVGDMQFVQAVRCFASGIETREDMALVQLVLDVGFKICCGEIDELLTDPTQPVVQLRQRYFRTIDRKTAVLFQLACESGASLVRARKRYIWKTGRYGRLLGRAFQIMDDLGDFMQTDEESGKLRGTDLLRRRPTLPILYALQELPTDHIVARILGGETASPAELDAAITAVVASNGFIRAYGEARAAAIAAARCLEVLPASPYRDTLVDLAYHVVDHGPELIEPAVAPTPPRTPAPAALPAGAP
ncbi:MAG TPA: polyprenyl synthetase family protein [Kofleriaceae bacterium]|nr:polyprenyl synthetase family protein [Kofleriaceae bacterium]